MSANITDVSVFSKYFPVTKHRKECLGDRTGLTEVFKKAVNTVGKFWLGASGLNHSYLCHQMPVHTEASVDESFL